MKKLLLLIVLIPLASFAEEPLVFGDVVKVDSTLKAHDIYSSALAWTASAYKNANFVVQLKDESNFQIIGKASMNYDPKEIKYFQAIKGHFDYTFKILCKDGRYKYELGPFEHIPTEQCDFGHVMFETISSDSILQRKIDTHGFWFISKKWLQNTWIDMRSQIKNYSYAWAKDLEKSIISRKQENNW